MWVGLSNFIGKGHLSCKFGRLRELLIKYWELNTKELPKIYKIRINFVPSIIGRGQHLRVAQYASKMEASTNQLRSVPHKWITMQTSPEWELVRCAYFHAVQQQAVLGLILRAAVRPGPNFRSIHNRLAENYKQSVGLPRLNLTRNWCTKGIQKGLKGQVGMEFRTIWKVNV